MGYVTKIGIIGLGHVGAHVANSCMLQGVGDEFYLCDIDDAKLKSEVQDLRDSIAFLPHHVKVFDCGAHYEQLAGCDIIVNAAGKVALVKDGRDGELEYTTNAARTFISRITQAGFKGIWISISNPCDVVATQIWHTSGCDPRRVIGSGTALDSARFRHVLSRETGIAQHSIGCYMLGEHGASQFAAWSQVHFGDKPLAELETEDPVRFGFDKDLLEDQARQGGFVTFAAKRCTEYAIANAATRLIKAVIHDEKAIIACSTLLTGQYGLEGHFTSLPCVIGKDGVEEVLTLNLSEGELEKLRASCAHVRDNISKLSWWDEDVAHPE